MSATTAFLHELAAIFTAAAVLLYIGKRTDQPSIPLYILAGVLLGGSFLGILDGAESLLTMAQLGIIFLLFTAGLETEIEELQDIGTVILAAGLSHTLIAAVVGYLLSAVLGFSATSSLYIALFVAFSSTMEVLQILEKRFELNTLHGRLIVGILLIEDFIAIIALSGLTSYAGGFTALTQSVISATGIFSMGIVASKYITPHVFRHIDDSREHMVLAALTTCFIFMGLTWVSGLPLAIGAFTGGLTLTKFPYGIEIRNSIRSLRDFFGTIFFVSLGALVDLAVVSTYLGPLLALTALVIFVKPVLTYLMMSLFGYGQRTAFLTGLGLGQVSEFSLFILMQGFLLGAVGDTVFTLLLAVAVISITLSSFAYKNHEAVYGMFSDSLIDLTQMAFRSRMEQFTDVPDDLSDHVILLGCHIQGQEVLRNLKDSGQDILVVDYNSELIRRLKDQGHNVYYGDVANIEFSEIHVEDAAMIVCTIPGTRINELTVERGLEHDVPTIVRASGIDAALGLYSSGADYVVFPDMLSAAATYDILDQSLDDPGRLQAARKENLAYLSAQEETHLIEQYGHTRLQEMAHDHDGDAE